LSACERFEFLRQTIKRHLNWVFHILLKNVAVNNKV